jgi:hypothetical protein
MALGTWNGSVNVLGIQYHDRITILGLTITNTVQRSSEESWKRTTDIIRAKATDNCARMLTMDTRIKYIQEQLYARAWYVAQVFTPTDTCVRQLTSTIGVFLWMGDLFRVPLSTL